MLQCAPAARCRGQPWPDRSAASNRSGSAAGAERQLPSARAFGTDLAAAVDRLVRGLLLELEDWQRAIGALGAGLTAAAQERPLPEWAADASRTEDARRRQARQALLEAIARHHHGGPGAW
ncbi:hypothetical protein ACFWJ4_15400 [Kitasatospora sp. NPDC127067]|uniref:hypothetical protein n=1 Tax=Kitasatospora sp. NPDC127067 TaxID=3347126 RepID=UPI003656A3B1